MGNIDRMYRLMSQVGPWSHLGRAAALIIQQQRLLKGMR